jgi:UDP-N-acetylmuramyl pentapeptide synthase
VRDTVAAFGDGARHFESVEALAQALQPAAAPFAFGSVLVKGSRFMRMERVIKSLAPNAAGGESH